MPKRIYIQGSRNPDPKTEALIRQFGTLMLERGCTCLVGSQGKIPRILEEVGVPCVWHAASEFPNDVSGDRVPALTQSYQSQPHRLGASPRRLGGERRRLRVLSRSGRNHGTFVCHHHIRAP